MRVRLHNLAVGDLVSFSGEEHLTGLFLDSDCSSSNSEFCSVSKATEVAHASVHWLNL